MARLSAAAVAGVAGFGLTTAAPAFAEQGVTVQINELPGAFVAGGEPAAVTAVASKSRGDCVKIRWSLVLGVEGAKLAGLRLNRIEEDGSFPVDVRTDGNSARVTDRRLDPGRLCEERTVTAQYDIRFASDALDGDAIAGDQASGRVTLAAEAFSAEGQLLDRTTVTRDVKSGAASASPSAGPAEDPPAPASPPASAAAGGLSVDRTSGQPGVVRLGPIGLGVGAIMVLLGLGMLVKVRRRAR